MNDITHLECAMGFMLATYIKHQGENQKLTKSAFLKMLKEELPSFGQGEHGEEIFSGVDINQDGSIDFKEFAMLVTMYAYGNYEALHAALRESEKKK